MELGKGKLLRSGLNALYQAIHPVHGLAWTDGKQVILTALHHQNEDPKFGNSVVIGQFEHVHGLYWGPAHSGDIPALLAVQHKKHVTVWQLYYNNSEKNKLLVSQTCEVGDPLPVLPQGCVWHPSKDILVILTKRDVSIMHSVRTDNVSVKADIKSTGVVHCACWTKDGSRLVVAISSALHSYIWDGKNNVLNACSFCPIFDVGGYICAIESTVDSQVAVATELPLDRICSLNAGIAFDVPAAPDTSSFSAQPALLLMDEEFSLDVGRKSTDSGTSLSTDSPVTSPGTLDLTHILVGHSKPDLSPLLNLKRKDYITGSGQDSSHLILVNFEKKVTSTRKVSIPGILVPDMLAFDQGAHIVAVASNTCSHVLVYSLTSTNMPNIQQIQLEKNERPKGLYFLTEKMLLVLVGRQKACDPAFLPSSSSDKYIIRLMVKEVMFDEDSSTSSTEIPSAPSSYESSMVSRGKKKYVNSFLKDDPTPNCGELLMPGSSSGRPVLSKKQLIEEIRSYNSDLASNTCDFDDRKAGMTVHDLDTEPKNRSVTLGLDAHRKPPSRPTSPKLDYQASSRLPNYTKNCSPLPGQDIQYMSRNMERLCYNMSNLQQRLQDLTDVAQNGRKSNLPYPSFKDSPYVTIKCQYHTDSPPVRKSILLCDNKLRLNTLQELFCLSLVEMKLGSSCWITLTADSEGFIPLTFSPSQELCIRDARSSPSSPLDEGHHADSPSSIT